MKWGSFEVDENGYGMVVYTVQLLDWVYLLIVFVSFLVDEDRTDCVIVLVWDVAFVLFDGIPL